MRTAASCRATDAGAAPPARSVADVARRASARSTVASVGRASSSQAQYAVEVAAVGGERVRATGPARPPATIRNSSTSSGSVGVDVGVAAPDRVSRSRSRRSTSSSPMIVLASVISPVGDHRQRLGERHVERPPCASSSGPCSLPSAPACRSVARYRCSTESVIPADG